MANNNYSMAERALNSMVLPNNLKLTLERGKNEKQATRVYFYLDGGLKASKSISATTGLDNFKQAYSDLIEDTLQTLSDKNDNKKGYYESLLDNWMNISLDMVEDEQEQQLTEAGINKEFIEDFKCWDSELSRTGYTFEGYKIELVNFLRYRGLSKSQLYNTKINSGIENVEFVKLNNNRFYTKEMLQIINNKLIELK